MKKILLLRCKNPIFQKIKHPLHFYPPMTLKHIQLCLEQKFNFQTKLIDGWTHKGTMKEMIQSAIDFQPDCLIAYMEKPTEKQNLTDFIAQTQRNNLLKIGIGPDVSTRSKEYIHNQDIFDFCVSGEPEEAINFFFEKLTQNKTKKDDLVEFFKKEMESGRLNVVGDLEQLSPLRFSGNELRAYPFTYPLRFNKKLVSGYTMTSRGCPGDCIFCSPMVRKSYGKRIRHKPIKTVIEEIKNMAQQGANFISFEDDNFASNTQYLHELCYAIINDGLKIKWSAQIRADLCLDETALILMKKSGCILLQLGVETASEKLLESLKKTPRSELWKIQCLESFKKIKKHKIATCALFIIGIPEETELDIQESIEFAVILNPDFIKLHFFTLYPGCQAYEANKNDALLPRPELMHHHYAADPAKKELIKKRTYFYTKFILRPTFLITHLMKYCGFYLKNIDIFKFLIKNTLNMAVAKTPITKGQSSA